MIFASFVCLLVVPLAFECVQSGPVSALKRQKKSLHEDDLPYFKSERSHHSSFRERQNEFMKPFSKKNKEGSSSSSSVFSERRHLLESQNNGKERKKGRISGDVSYDLDDGFENKRTLPQYIIRKRQLADVWFPALEAKKRFDFDPEREAIDSALKHMAWERLNKRLVKLNDVRGSYLDRGERRIRIAKRVPKALEDKDLDAILSDDVSPETIPMDTAGQKSTVNKNDSSKAMVRKQDKQKPLVTTTVPSVDKTASKSNQESVSKKEKEMKGRQWVPLDSEPTLRSKKSWDDYFGIDKRSSRSYPRQWQVVGSIVDNDDNNNDDDNDDETMVSDPELKDSLMQWYMDKMLRKMTLKEDEESEGMSENKMKKRKMLEMVEGEEQSPDGGLNEEEQDVEEDSDDDQNEPRWDSSKEFAGIIPFQEVDERLRKIEDDILLETTQLLEKDAQNLHFNEKGDSNVAQKEREVVNHLKAAFNVEKMRDALEDFQDSYNKIQPQQTYGGDVVVDDFGDVDDDQKKKKKKKRTKDEDKKTDDTDVYQKKQKKGLGKKSTMQTVKSVPRTTSSKISAGKKYFLASNFDPITRKSEFLS